MLDVPAAPVTPDIALFAGAVEAHTNAEACLLLAQRTDAPDEALGWAIEGLRSALRGFAAVAEGARQLQAAIVVERARAAALHAEIEALHAEVVALRSGICPLARREPASTRSLPEDPG